MNQGLYQLGQPESSTEGRGVTAMKAASGQKMGGREGDEWVAFLLAVSG